MHVAILEQRLAQDPNYRSGAGTDSDSPLDVMAAEALRSMMQMLLNDLQKRTSHPMESDLESWSSTLKELHALKGSIKAVEGMMEGKAPPLLTETIALLDDCKAMPTSASTEDRSQILGKVRSMFVALMTWIKTGMM